MEEIKLWQFPKGGGVLTEPTSISPVPRWDTVGADGISHRYGKRKPVIVRVPIHIERRSS